MKFARYFMGVAITGLLICVVISVCTSVNGRATPFMSSMFKVSLALAIVAFPVIMVGLWPKRKEGDGWGI